MTITLSPTKIMDFKGPLDINETTEPQFIAEANDLYNSLLSLSSEKIGDLMGINGKLSREAYNYIQHFPLEETPSRQAVFAYNGISYQGLDARNMTKGSLDFAQKHLAIMSGLYGLLRPLDVIKPYRLEMQTALTNSKGNNLYDFWSDTISKQLAKLMAADDNIWISLTSKEYFKAINRKLLPKGHKVIFPVFKEDTGNGYKQIVVYTKKARGMMSKFIIENQLTDVEHLKAFDYEKYFFSKDLSTATEWVFIR